MKINIKISEKDQKLLCLLISLILIAASYFLVYTKNVSKAQEINTANEALQAKADELAGMEANADAKKTEIKEFKKQIEEMESKFPVSLNTADAIVMLNELEKYAGMNIPSISFSMNQVFYSSASTDSTSGSTETNKVAVDSVSASPDALDGSSAGTATTNTAENSSGTQSSGGTDQTPQFLGLKSTVSITYQTSYEGLKKAIDFINQNKDRMTMESLSTAYDTSTGNLLGSIVINMYSLSGTEIKKEYEEPYIDGINVGRDNLFGTQQ